MESDQRIQEAVKTAYLRGKEVTGKGIVATYIPELGKARPEAVGICIHTKDGKVFKAGDSGIRFTMQSVSKLLSLAMALEIRVLVSPEERDSASTSTTSSIMTPSTTHKGFDEP